MVKFKVELHIGGEYNEPRVIECKSLEIKDNCYCFWNGEYNEPRVLVAAYPMQFTVVKEIVND